MQDRVIGVGGLDEDRRFIGIDPDREPIDEHLTDELPDAARVGIVRRKGMPIGDEEKAVVSILKGFPIVQRSQEIAEVKESARLHAAENAFPGHSHYPIPNPPIFPTMVLTTVPVSV